MTNRFPDETVPAPDDDLCLAYANTRYSRGTVTPTEQLNGPDDLLKWAAATERLPPLLIDRVTTCWRERPDEAAVSFGEATNLREAIFRCFAATTSGRPPSEGDMAALNAALATAPPRQRLRLGGWDIGTPELSVGALLAPTLWSAADLLVGTQLQRVRQCANPECGWLFLDNSKSGNRRWCSMSACGNRAKAHRHYLRRKEQ
ncbi:MAG TPA: CGNR zinc finger domain-containing protein [Acetobacteraceae bacterium]|jgi:predicted RNA-binding Zn ribbon-like protein|nr:CGNR zinc finger domain-containing protein [Acetobacteraceae bacterium]